MTFNEVFEELKDYFTSNYPNFKYFDNNDWFHIKQQTYPGANTEVGYHITFNNSQINDNYFIINWSFSFAIDNRISDHFNLLNDIYESLINMLTYSFPFTGLNIGFENTKDVFVKNDTSFNNRSEYTIYNFINIVTTVNHDISILFDYDGNIYPTAEIGGQTWTAAPLRTTHLNDGTSIANVKANDDWLNLTDAGYCAYNNDDADVQTYGLLYNGYTALKNNIAPLGWKIPSDDDWKTLEQYLGMSNAQANLTGDRGTDEGGKLKATGTNQWHTPNTGATNLAGFNNFPSGYRNSSDASLSSKFYNSLIWTNSLNLANIYIRKLSYNKQTIYRNSVSKLTGCSIYCVRK